MTKKSRLITGLLAAVLAAVMLSSCGGVQSNPG